MRMTRSGMTPARQNRAVNVAGMVFMSGVLNVDLIYTEMVRNDGIHGEGNVV